MSSYPLEDSCLRGSNRGLSRVLSLWVFLLALCVGPIGHGAPPEFDREGAIARFSAILKAALPQATISVDGEQVSVAMPDNGPSGVAALSATLDDMAVMSTEIERESRLSALAARMVKSVSKRDEGTDWASAAKTIVPVVRSELSFRIDEGVVTATGSSKEGLRFPRVPWLGELAIGFALDRPDAVLRVAQGFFAGWKKSEQELVPIAIANLRAIDKAPFEKHRDGFYVAARGDTLDASRVLLIEEIRALGLKGAPLAMIATRDMLVVVSDSDPDIVQKALAFAEANREGGRIVHAPVLRLGAKGWEVYGRAAMALVNKEARPVDKAILRYNLIAKLRLHAEQKEQLEPLFPDDFVATLNAYDVQGRDLELVTLTATVPTLLPRAEVVGLVDLGEDGSEPRILGYVDFERLIEVLGPRAKPLNLSPERWRIETAFTPADLEALAPRERPL